MWVTNKFLLDALVSAYLGVVGQLIQNSYGGTIDNSNENPGSNERIVFYQKDIKENENVAYSIGNQQKLLSFGPFYDENNKKLGTLTTEKLKTDKNLVSTILSFHYEDGSSFTILGAFNNMLVEQLGGGVIVQAKGRLNGYTSFIGKSDQSDPTGKRTIEISK